MIAEIDRWLFLPDFRTLGLIYLFLLPSFTANAQSFGNDKARGTITACLGMASASPNIQRFTVFGNALTTAMEIDAPQYFEVSLSPQGPYQSNVTVNPVNGNIDNAVIYARSSASAPLGNVTGQCIISTSGYSGMDPILSATIYTLPTVDSVPNQTLLTGKTTQPINFTGMANTFTWVNNTPAIGLAASGSGNIAAFAAVNNGSQPVTATINVTAIAAGFAYVPNYNDGTVSVINTTTQKAEKVIPVGTNPYGIVLTGDGSLAYVSNQGSGTVSVINTQTNAVTNTIKLGNSPSGLALTTDGNLFVANTGDNTVSYVNPATNTEEAYRQVGQAPVNILISLDDTKMYIANSTSNTIAVMSTGDLQIITTIPVGKSPSGMAISPDGNKLYVANSNDNTIAVISTVFNTVTTTVSIGTSTGPTGVLTSGDGGLLYVTGSTSNTVAVINTTTNTLVATIPVDKNPAGIAKNADGTLVYVSNFGSNTLSVINTATNTVDATIPTGQGPFSFGKFLKIGSGCQSTPLKFTITVNPPTFPTITAAGPLAGINTVYGTPSTAEAFTISGANMVAGILVTPPAGFEVSTDNINFSNTVTVGTAGDIAPTIVYIRLTSSTPVGTYSGNIVLSSSAPAASVNIKIGASTVSPAILTITADNKSRIFGAPNPPLTLTYSGFQNNDNPAKLTTQPQISTTAAISSPAGQYPITITGAASPNNTFLYVPGVLTVEPPLFIPNTFTPNGDGVNDKWDITSLNTFASCTVEIFNRWGQNVFSSIGYGTPWNGTYKGATLPTGTYYYIIDLKNGGKLLSGFVAIVR